MTDRLEVKADLSVTDAGEITGVAWPFGSADRVGDVIVKGAFTGPARLPMLWSHDQAQVVGVWDEIAETDTGLTVKGRLLIEDVERAREVRAMVKAGAVSGLSIGFVAKDAKREGKGRRITALELHEISIVAVPAHPGAQITSLKSTHSNKDISRMENETTPAQVPQIDTKAFDEIKTRLDKLEAKGNRPGIIAPGTQNPVMGEDEVKGFTDYLRTGERKNLAYSVPSTGSILAPETVSASIIEKIAEQSPMRGLASSISMSGPLLQLPRLVDEVQPEFVTETGARPESEPTFEQIDLKPFEMAVIVPVTRVLLEDAQVDLNAYLEPHRAPLRPDGSAVVRHRQRHHRRRRRDDLDRGRRERSRRDHRRRADRALLFAEDCLREQRRVDDEPRDDGRHSSAHRRERFVPLAARAHRRPARNPSGPPGL